MRTSTARQRWCFDGGLAVLTGLGVVLAPRLPLAGSASPHDLDALGYLLFLGSALAVAGRRRWPVPVLAITVVGFVFYHGLGYPGPVFAIIPGIIAVYTAASRGHRQAAILGTTAVIIGKLVGGWLLTGNLIDAIIPVIWVKGWVLAALVWGEVNRHRRAYLEQVEQRALDAERGREEAARRRADEERLRIARELHDTLTHAISVVNVQSSVALHLLHRKPELVEPALLAIRDASQDAMRELRATLGVLRAATPQPPGLDQLPELAARFEHSGLAVRVRVDGDEVPVPPDTEHAAYRMVQEALTNTARHAASATVEAAITYHATYLEVCVDDDGRGPDGPVCEGHGLRGMRERAVALGGTLVAGPRPGGGFRVHATLPLPLAEPDALEPEERHAEAGVG